MLRYAADLSAALGAAIRLVGDDIEIFWRYGEPFLAITSGEAEGHFNGLFSPFHPKRSTAASKRSSVACDRGDILEGLSDHAEFLKKLHTLLGASFEFVHIVKDCETSVEKIIREYSAWKSRPDFFPKSPFFIQRQDPREGMIDYLDTYPADWLMVLPKEHSWIEFHKSRAGSIAAASPIPVLHVYE